MFSTRTPRQWWTFAWTPLLAAALLLGVAPSSPPVAASTSTALTDVTAVSAQLVFLAGTYTGYQFSSSGTVTGSRLYSLSRASSAPATQSATSAGMTYYYVSAGIWAGDWMPAGSGSLTRHIDGLDRRDGGQRTTGVPGRHLHRLPVQQFGHGDRQPSLQPESRKQRARHAKRDQCRDDLLLRQRGDLGRVLDACRIGDHRSHRRP